MKRSPYQSTSCISLPRGQRRYQVSPKAFRVLTSHCLVAARRHFCFFEFSFFFFFIIILL